MSKFLFEESHFLVDPNQCFLIMPFNPELRNVYDAIEGIVVDKCGLKCVRPDKLSGSNRITSDIWKFVNESRFVIADLTDRNPNVFYEVGIAHARNKPVIFITQNPSLEVPFDVREIRHIPYDLQNLGKIASELPSYIKEALTTIPANWNKNFLPPNQSGSYVKITSLEVPETVSQGQPFEITIIAKNYGAHAKQGYFSASFPSMVDKVEIIESSESIQTQTGTKGGRWSGGRVVLKYPIAEGYKYSNDSYSWANGEEFFMKVRAYSNKSGLLRYFVNACAQDMLSGQWQYDPSDKDRFDVDQRNETVYSGIIQVI
ncbi:MAG: hypothetical protein IPM31_01950 [Anaerolineae bacterium]|nr:hypothetical protein [Anaerolineae bacterium]MBL8105813.1 hypothetical protein [Anaerolineales bacterium]